MEGNSYRAKNISRYGSIKLSVKYSAAFSRESRARIIDSNVTTHAKMIHARMEFVRLNSFGSVDDIAISPIDDNYLGIDANSVANKNPAFTFSNHHAERPVYKTLPLLLFSCRASALSITRTQCRTCCTRRTPRKSTSSSITSRRCSPVADLPSNCSWLAVAIQKYQCSLIRRRAWTTSTRRAYSR